ncbi:MAG: dimethyl sulfoxide reductase anchor subunit [Arenimonas sp.]|uniref:dimethyl sulfoxide reductase anchor subunit family protein n=1 Tax=Arenimonas sp. TaxID=1872635 RepID=UPI0025C4BB2A|nr:DmsC/YnfH family molybdoenzyme membrane anchor subunit [Arenimonas sp.]MBW8366817.1 dimethyl sulfoxide reductase anchor subunit [Arenimonas sp.]
MHPAFSVILFTTASGLGYGLWFWLSLSLLGSPGGLSAYTLHLVGLAAGFVLVSLGLLSSTLHLGKPLRAWRAFSQWRTSWLSREGVLALATYLPLVALVVLLVSGMAFSKLLVPVLLVLLAALSMATVACTAMIYASLKPIPAWSHALVLPAYLGFALLTGGLGALALLAADQAPHELLVLAALMLAIAMMVLKRRYWRDIDRGELPVTRASALGLPADRVATVFERPHTEANYLTREMGYVLARKHALKLRRLALLLFGGLPAAACALTLLHPGFALSALSVAAVSALLGAMVERWLFFAQARHVVMLYY